MSYSVRKVTDDIVYIVDNDDGMSVTNMAEHVVFEVNKHYPNRRIVYKDTEGHWDELLHEHGVFKGFKYLDVRINL